MSPTTRSNKEKDIETVIGDIASTQSTGLALSSPLSTSSLDLLSGVLKMSAENSALHAKLTENLNKTIENLLLENARLHKQLANISNLETLAQNSSVANDDFSKFTCFNRLPIELRITIWKLVAHRPRIVEVRMEKVSWVAYDDDNEKEIYERRKFRVLNHTPPAIMHVSQESRNEAKRYYNLGSACMTEIWQHETYFNIDSDILYLEFCLDTEDGYGRTFLKDMAASRGWGGLRRIAIRADTFNRLEGCQGFASAASAQAVTEFARLGITEILLVDESYTEDCLQKKSHFSPPNRNRNLTLTNLNDYDRLKRNVTQCIDEEILSVGDFLYDVDVQILDAFDNAKPGFDQIKSSLYHSLRTMDSYKPALTMWRLKFAQPKETKTETENGEVEDELEYKPKQGKRKITWL